MKEYEIDIKEIKEILKKIQEDINRLENNFPYYSVNECGPAANNYLPSNKSFSCLVYLSSILSNSANFRISVAMITACLMFGFLTNFLIFISFGL